MFLKLLLQVDGGEWRAVPDVSAMCIGNAKYFGGGMKITPTADPFNGKLEVSIHHSSSQSLEVPLKAGTSKFVWGLGLSVFVLKSAQQLKLFVCEEDPNQ